MPSRRGATAACAALVAVLLLVAVPTTAAGGAVTADDGRTETSFLDYFLGDMFHMPGQMEPKPPLFRPWKIFNVSGASALAFNCASDVPSLRLLPPSDHHKQDANNSSDASIPLPDTCGGLASSLTTPVQYKFSRRDKPGAGYSAMFWSQPADAHREKEEENGAAARPLMPLPKLQLKAILKFLAAVMDAAWRGENGEDVLESVAFPADTVAFYVKKAGWLVVMGREDVEFHKPWERLDGNIKDLTLGAVV